MRAFVTLPAMVTTGNLTAGFLALLLVGQGMLLQAAVLIILAAVLDSVDGVVARRASREGAFGENLDSLADVVSFGVVPALALYVGLLHTLSILGLAASLGFLVCGAWRLARFPLVRKSHCFVGLPLPPAGVLVAWLAALGTPQVFALLGTSALSVLMVSEMPFPKLTAICHLKKLSSKWPPHAPWRRKSPRIEPPS